MLEFNKVSDKELRASEYITTSGHDVTYKIVIKDPKSVTENCHLMPLGYYEISRSLADPAVGKHFVTLGEKPIVMDYPEYGLDKAMEFCDEDFNILVERVNSPHEVVVHMDFTCLVKIVGKDEESFNEDFSKKKLAILSKLNDTFKSDSSIYPYSCGTSFEPYDDFAEPYWSMVSDGKPVDFNHSIITESKFIFYPSVNEEGGTIV